MNYWLMKSEPETFSIDDLKNRPNQTAWWDNIRNYQARNMLRDDMKKGDLAFFYHSSCKPPGIVGIMEIVKEAYVDHMAFDPNSPYYDPTSKPEKPRWYLVDVKFKKKFSRMITLEELKGIKALAKMPVVRKGNRLSVTPVTREEWDLIINLVK